MDYQDFILKNWKILLLVVAILILVWWWYRGGRNYEVVGLSPFFQISPAKSKNTTGVSNTMMDKIDRTITHSTITKTENTQQDQEISNQIQMVPQTNNIQNPTFANGQKSETLGFIPRIVPKQVGVRGQRVKSLNESMREVSSRSDQTGW
jgi:hypothetical protein